MMSTVQAKLAAEFFSLGATKDAAENSAAYVVAHATEILHPMSITSITVDKGVLKIVGSGFGATKGKAVASLGSGPDVADVAVTKWSDTAIEATAYVGASKDDTIAVTGAYGTVNGVIGN